MTVRPRIVLVGVALALAMFLGIVLVKKDQRRDLIGLTDRPCTAAGNAVTGYDADDWAGLCSYRADNARLIARGQRPTVVLIGDSLTLEWPAGPAGEVNRGIGGQASGQVLLRFTQDALALRPRAIHLMVGTNDAGGAIGLVTEGQVRDNLIAMATLAKAHGIPLIVATIPPARPREWKWAPTMPASVLRVNRVIREAAREQGLTLADYYPVLVGPDGALKPAFDADGIHMTPAAYAAMRPVFEAAVAKALSGSR